MKKIANVLRAKRLIDNTVQKIGLNLSSMTVLTEMASGNFIVTPLIAALGNADKVYVVCKDSMYGTADDVWDYLLEMMDVFNISKDQICYIKDKKEVAGSVHIITNLGFVRPIDQEFISNLPYDAAIPLMFESWEFRDADIDVAACQKYNIPILGTSETHPDLKIFKYVGMSVLKLLLDSNIEVFKSRILLISSGNYMEETKDLLTKNGAIIKVYNPYDSYKSQNEIQDFLQSCDAVVVAEQRHHDILIGKGDNHINIEWLLYSKPCIIHIAGLVDYDLIEKNCISKYPASRIGYGYMTVTTEHVGIRPVIELHTAGLKVGQSMVEGLRIYKDINSAKKYALNNSPAMDFECREEEKVVWT